MLDGVIVHADLPTVQFPDVGYSTIKISSSQQYHWVD